MKRLGVGAVLGLALALAPASLRAGDKFQGHFNYGDMQFTPKDAFAVRLPTSGKGTHLVFSDFALDRQALLDSNGFDLEPFETQARAAKGRYIALYLDDHGCRVVHGLGDTPYNWLARTSSLKETADA